MLHNVHGVWCMMHDLRRPACKKINNLQKKIYFVTTCTNNLRRRKYDRVFSQSFYVFVHSDFMQKKIEKTPSCLCLFKVFATHCDKKNVLGGFLNLPFLLQTDTRHWRSDTMHTALHCTMYSVLSPVCNKS